METMVIDEFVADDMVYSDGMDYVDGKDFIGDTGFIDGTDGTTAQISMADKLMSSWVFVGGVTAGVLVIGFLLGFLSAKRKIKKGIDLYED